MVNSPEDMPSEIDERIAEIVKSPNFLGTEDDVQRLRTFAYADLAMSELVTRVGHGLERSVFIFGADHATADPFVWKTGADWNRHAAHALIPFVILLPEPLIATSARKRSRPLA